MSLLSEDEIIDLCFRPLTKAGDQRGDRACSVNPLNLEDDAALLTPAPGHQLVLSKDILLAGQHFFKDDHAADIAAKALAVNLSDLAAKAATPCGFLLGLALPEAPTKAWGLEFANGLREMSERYDCPLLGGDTTGSKGGLMLSVTVLGEVKEGGMIKRSGAAVGDHLFVTGTLGDAALGYKLKTGALNGSRAGLSHNQQRDLLTRYHRPRPRLEAQPLLRQFATAAMDLSDGLVRDLPKLAAASGLEATVSLPAIPLSEAARQCCDSPDAGTLFDEIISWGDDYELLFTVKESEVTALQKAATTLGLPLRDIGTLKQRAQKSGPPVTWVDEDGSPTTLKAKPFCHFGETKQTR